MPKWTNEQQLAIDSSGSNIIVSAGAGSGKTAVLSERVIRILEEGVDINRLLLLTFTKAAAIEMMSRIRDKIKERPHLKDQLDKIDSAYITTFDSFSLSLVKKYHYLLGIKKDIKVIDANIIHIEKKKALDEIFEDYYQKEVPSFFKLLSHFTLKDDQEIKDLILSINNHLDLKYDKISYLENYVEEAFKEETICQLKAQWLDFLKEKIGRIKTALLDLADYTEESYIEELKIVLNPLFESKTYREMVEHQEIKLKNLPKDSDPEAKKKKELLTSYIKELRDLFTYQSEEEIDELLEESKAKVQVIVEILKKLDKKVSKYKRKKESYEFTDIAKMAISLVKENSEIQEEMRESFHEIMVDEYQDTSDLQEEFISSIANNNVYMVGDIKQSIYRFRNANPYIFKNKYDSYGQGIGGIKIDLMKNFRSREEVLANINYIFNYIMDDVLGGCKYEEEHQMVFGNMMYDENKEKNQNSNFEVYNYQIDKELGFTKEEVEAFLVLKDIKSKIQNHYQVIDKKTGKLRDTRYEDFTILMDRATQFELYKKIFEYENVPLAVYKDTSITKEDDVYILNNLLKLIYLSYHKTFDEEFRYSYVSIARSYLEDEDDKEIFHTIKENVYFESEIYRKISPILKDYSKLNGISLLEGVIEAFDIYEKQIKVGNIEHLTARISYLKQLFEEMGHLGYSLDEIILNFDKMVTEGYDIKISFGENNENAVKIMTIHKSKGLEFPILYMTGLSNKFNIRDLNEKFLYDNTYGIVIPFYKDQGITNILKPLIKDNYIKEEISEKIRLFYVALTRAKEKMILVTCNEKEEDTDFEKRVSLDTRFKYRSFLDILKSIWTNLNPYKKEIELDSLGLTKEYNQVKKTNYQNSIFKSEEKIEYQEIKLENKTVEDTKFSKTTKSLLTKEACKAIELGKRFHTIFENIDFQNPDYSLLTEFEKKQVQSFLSLSIFKNIKEAKIYKEYEFYLEESGLTKHGIIDLLVEYPEKIILIDYKLKDTTDAAYQKQLNGYRDYIIQKTQKEVDIYLYSILSHELIEFS